MEKYKYSPGINRPRRKLSLTGIFAAAALAVLAGCTQVKFIKLKIQCSNPNPNTLCITGDTEHECATKVLQDWAKGRCKKIKILRPGDGSKCIRCDD